MIRVIVVEDDPLVAQLNAVYLSRLDGFQVTGVFTNSLEALNSLRENPVELAIVDVYMPVCTGVELLRRMRSEQLPTAVIMITAATVAGNKASVTVKLRLWAVRKQYTSASTTPSTNAVPMHSKKFPKVMPATASYKLAKVLSNIGLSSTF